ncbi:MAG: aldehyde dehydrogenase [Bacteroidetes bacterium RIFCSPLOWO2_12_FULL_37_12]|nr:MAG: aldehyde dehydrogenase [Bacteroidetes bacterium RIFCSPLOWO2_12_FULL_37_12]
MSEDILSNRLSVAKTYKLYIGGQFPRTESGRYYEWNSPSNHLKVNICRASKKDFREAVVSARNAFSVWNKMTAFNRSQIVYRMAEIMEGRKAQFVEELVHCGSTEKKALAETEKSIDRLVYYAGWCDKYQQIFSSVNPVASSHFNFSVPEPTGVVSVIAPEEYGLLGLISTMAPVISGANCCVTLASQSKPLPAITLAEVLNDSDLPGGVINILTGFRSELLEHFSTHMDVNGILYCGNDEQEKLSVQKNATLNVKRVVLSSHDDWFAEAAQSPYHIQDFQEIKTTWHPMGV